MGAGGWLRTASSRRIEKITMQAIIPTPKPTRAVRPSWLPGEWGLTGGLLGARRAFAKRLTALLLRTAARRR
jgi:hypothetical protein